MFLYQEPLRSQREFTGRYISISFTGKMVVMKNRKFSRALAVFSMFLMFSTAGNAAETGRHFSFAEAWYFVESRNDSLKAARSKVQQAEYEQESTTHLDFPEVSLSAAYLYLDDAVELTPQDIFASMEGGAQAGQIAAGIAHTYGLSSAQLQSGLTSTIAERKNISSSLGLSWPLYTGGRITAVQGIAADQTEEAKHDFDLNRLEQFELLTRYYFGTVLARKVLETRRAAEARLKKHNEHALHLEEQGQIARVERMQAEASYDKAVVERKKAQRDLEIARVAITRLMKSAEPVLPSDDLFIADTMPDIDQFMRATLSRYPALEVIESKRNQAEGLAAVERGKYLPSVALMGHYSLYEEDNLATELTPEWFVGVGLKFTLLDRSGRSEKLLAAKSAVERLEHMKHQAKSDLSVLVDKTYRHAHQAIEEYQGLQSSRQLARETVQLRMKAFNQGLGTSLDVVDAELFLASIETQRAVAAYNSVVALGKLFAISNRTQAFINCQKNEGKGEHQCAL